MAVLCRKDVAQRSVFPRLNVVVQRVFPQNEPFDRVAVVVNQEDDRFEIVSKDRREFLCRQLERSVANEQDMAALRSSYERPKRSRERVTDRPPQGLTDKAALAWKPQSSNAARRRTVFRQTNITLQQKALNPIPEGHLCQLFLCLRRRLARLMPTLVCA